MNTSDPLGTRAIARSTEPPGEDACGPQSREQGFGSFMLKALAQSQPAPASPARKGTPSGPALQTARAQGDGARPEAHTTASDSQRPCLVGHRSSSVRSPANRLGSTRVPSPVRPGEFSESVNPPADPGEAAVESNLAVAPPQNQDASSADTSDPTTASPRQDAMGSRSDPSLMGLALALPPQDMAVAERISRLVPEVGEGGGELGVSDAKDSPPLADQVGDRLEDPGDPTDRSEPQMARALKSSAQAPGGSDSVKPVRDGTGCQPELIALLGGGDSKMQKTDSQWVTPTSPLQEPPRSGAEASGTSSASPAMTMKEMVNLEILAERGEQFLPPGSLTQGTGVGDQVTGPSADLRSSKVRAADLTLPAHAAALWVLPQPESSGMRLPVAAEGVDARLVPTAARVETLIQDHVFQLRQIGADSMTVLLKPDGQTELYLRLTMHHGVVEARAELNGGDYSALNAHWPALQQKLAEQSIRVGPLGRELSLPTGGGGESNQQPPRRQASNEVVNPSRPVSARSRGLRTTQPVHPTPSNPTVAGLLRWQRWA
jgi:hypothetical protein